jgi:hypothetical protein
MSGLLRPGTALTAETTLYFTNKPSAVKSEPRDPAGHLADEPCLDRRHHIDPRPGTPARFKDTKGIPGKTVSARSRVELVMA